MYYIITDRVPKYTPSVMFVSTIVIGYFLAFIYNETLAFQASEFISDSSARTLPQIPVNTPLFKKFVNFHYCATHYLFEISTMSGHVHFTAGLSDTLYTKDRLFSWTCPVTPQDASLSVVIPRFVLHLFFITLILLHCCFSTWDRGSSLVIFPTTGCLRIWKRIATSWS